MDFGNVWNKFLPYQTAAHAQSFLKQCYVNQGLPDALSKSYKNGYPFCYYFEHARKFYTQAETADVEVKPILLFYGLIQLIKACLLIKNPDYPEDADVLAHGVTSRKRKKFNYSFSQDTVKIQKRGLFTTALENLYGVQTLPAEKWSMRCLLEQIPELNDLLAAIQGEHACIPVSINKEHLYVPRDILDDWNVSERRLAGLLTDPEFKSDINSGDEFLIFPYKKRPQTWYILPFLQDMNGNLYLTRNREYLPKYPELFVHYLILYNLSMISRYETEWWYDLHGQRSANDLPYINGFLSITQQKTPLLTAQYIDSFEKSR